MSKLKVVTILGARPQFIKAGPVSAAFLESDIEETIIHTGQHYDQNMSDLFFNELGIPAPSYNLGVGSMSHAKQTGKMMAGIEDILIQTSPDFVVVYGDTNSTIAGSLCAVKLHIPVAHVEAGLRSFNRKMPEEINRILTDHASDLLFPSTELGYQNLLNEGISAEKIQNVGDVMYDATIKYGLVADEKSKIISQLNLSGGEYILATVHRAENTNDLTRLDNIFAALQMINKEMDVVIPLHPRTRKILMEQGKLEEVEKHLKVIEPIGYLDMLQLEKHAHMVMTDSGGIQKEAYFHQVPCITLRDETEWMELVDSGWNKIARPGNIQNILDAYYSSFDKEVGQNFYGDGTAAEKIAYRLKQ